MQDISRFHTIPHWKRAFNLSDKAMRAAIRGGELEAVRLQKNGWPMCSEAAIRAWLANRRIQSQ